jgi:hypothetical protein
LVSVPVGLVAGVSVAVALDEGAPVGALEVLLLGWPAPIGVVGVAGNGGGVDDVAPVDGVVGGVLVVVDE